MKVGESVPVGDYRIYLDGLRGQEEPHRFAVIAELTVERDGRMVGHQAPRLNFYPTQKQPVPTPNVRSTVREDLFISLTAFEPDGGSATLKFVVMPLVVWLWVSGAVMTAGILVAAWPRRRREEEASVVAGAAAVRGEPVGEGVLS